MKYLSLLETQQLRHYFIFFALAAYIFGIIAGQFHATWMLGFGLFISITISVWLLYRRNSNLFIGLALGAIILGGFMAVQIRTYQYDRLKPPPCNASIRVQVADLPEKHGDTIRFLAKTIPDPQAQVPPIKILVKMRSDAVVQYGDIWNLSGEFRAPKPPTNPGQMDYPQYLFFKNIEGIFYTQKAILLKKTNGNPFKKFAYFLNAKVLAINRATLPFPYSELYTGLVFGNQGTQLPDEMTEQFRATGLMHLLVVSGAQVALLSGILFTIFEILQIPLSRSFAAITIINIIFYFLTGGGASIFRAILMNEIVLGVRLLQRHAGFYHGFALTAFIMLLINPFNLLDIGAQLSFIATTALVFGVPKVAAILPESIPEKIRTALAMTIAPFLFTAPLLWTYFHTVSLISLVSNLLVVNLIEGLVIIGFFSTIIGFLFLPITYIVNQFSWVMMLLLTKSVDVLSAAPFANIHLQAPPVMLIVLLYILLWTTLIGYEQKNTRLLNISTLGGIGIAIYLLLRLFLPAPYLTVTVLDVGQGDSIVIRTPTHQTILIDAGDQKFNTAHEEMMNAGKQVVVPALSYWGVNKLDIVFATHQHSDHIGGLPYVIAHNRTYLQVNRTTVRQLTPYIRLGKDLTLRILHPIPNQPMVLDSNENNNSIALLLTYRNVRFLLTGDLEKEKESELVAAYSTQLHADVLKVGHHGSKTSTSELFLNAVHPSIAIISVGAKNKFGHPSPPTLTRLQSHAIHTFRTDQQGAISVVTDGKRIWIKR